MQITQHGNVFVLKLKGTYDMYEVKVQAPDFNILSVHKETYPDYWVVTSVNDLDFNSQDKLFQAVQKARRTYEHR